MHVLTGGAGGAGGDRHLQWKFSIFFHRSFIPRFISEIVSFDSVVL